MFPQLNSNLANAPRWTAFVALLLCATYVEACPTCKDALGSDPDRAGMVQGYFWSILFMMSMPFSILTGLGIYFYLQIRWARQAGFGDDIRAMLAERENASLESAADSSDDHAAWESSSESLISY